MVCDCAKVDSFRNENTVIVSLMGYTNITSVQM